MQDMSTIINFLIFSIIAGIVGTSGMTFSMYLMNKTGIANAKMVIAIGSILTKTRENAMRVGLIIHYTSGVFFGMVYTILFYVYGVTGVISTLGIGFFIGCIHGFVMTFILVIAVAEHHPLEEFREAGFAVAFAHFVGHMIYGALVGAVIGLSGIVGA